MTDQTTTATVLEQRLELRVTGQPDVRNKYGSGHVRATEVTLAYQASGMRAHVYGRWVREDGELTDARCSQPYTAHENDTSNWPDWLAELATQHAPAALVDEVRSLRAQVEAVAAVHEKGEHNGLAICLHCASQMFPPPETGIWSESAWPCETLRALGVTEDQPAAPAARSAAV